MGRGATSVLSEGAGMGAPCSGSEAAPDGRGAAEAELGTDGWGAVVFFFPRKRLRKEKKLSKSRLSTTPTPCVVLAVRR